MSLLSHIKCFTVSFFLTFDWLLSMTGSTMEDVKKLKVCIELNGLRLNKPHLPGEISQWLPSDQKSGEVNRKFRMDISAVRRSEVSGGWCDRAFVRRDGPRGTTRFFLSVISCD